jgi:hypothetical protein
VNEELDFSLPVTPYAGTSGWKGSEASHDRVIEDDADGTTSKRQKETLISLGAAGIRGLTWKELGEIYGWHAGQSSGCLSVLHLEGMVCRLTERRNRCSIYVLPPFVNGRETSKRKTNSCKHCGGEL